MNVAEQKCPFCHEQARGWQNLVACSKCLAVHHSECLDESLNKCSSCGHIRAGDPAKVIKAELDCAKHDDEIRGAWDGMKTVLFGLIFLIFPEYRFLGLLAILMLLLVGFLLVLFYRKRKRLRRHLRKLTEQHQMLLEQQSGARIVAQDCPEDEESNGKARQKVRA